MSVWEIHAGQWSVKPTAIVAPNSVEASLELVTALASALDIVVEVADVGGDVAGRRQSGERQEKGGLEGSHCV